MLTVLLVAWCALTTAAIVLVTRRHLDLIDKVEDIEEVISEASELLENRHASLVEKSKLEVFSDDQVVRDLVQDMLLARDAVAEAKKLLDQLVETLDEEQEDREDETEDKE